MTPSEKHIIETIIKDALARGYVLSVYDGEETTVTRSSNAELVFNNLATTDEDWLSVYKADGAKWVSIGTIFFVYGNEPGVVVADHTDNEMMNKLLTNANKLADAYMNAA